VILFARRRAVPVLTALLAAFAVGCEDLPNVPPSASFIFSPVSPIGAGSTPVTFNASGSSDSDGHIVTFTWDFGDGSGTQSESGPVVTHVFPNRAENCIQIVYAVLLTVEDDGGGHATASQNVTVTETCPR